MNLRKIVRWAALSILLTSFLLSSCAGTSMAPQMSYQGRLTSPSGDPLSGNYTMEFSIYNAASGGTAIHTETDTVNVVDGLFDTVVGPGSATAGLDPADLAQPLWLEVQVGDGAITETLTPRQRLYGAPYAFTLMPGTVISNTMGYLIYNANNVHGLVTIQNNYDGDGDFSSNAALPALNVVGDTGIQIGAPVGDDATIYTDVSEPSSDLFIYSNDEYYIYLDHDDDENGNFYVWGNPGEYCSISDAGSLRCTGSITANVRSSVVDSDGESRLMYSVESPELWMEDFGAGTLANGAATVTLDTLFAETVNLDEYHVYVTPLGDCEGLYVSNKSATGFEVHELGGGTSNIEFDYRIVAHRAGYEEVRMPVDTSAKSAEADE